MARQAKSQNGNGSAAVAELEREIGQLMDDLEARLTRLNGLAKRESKQVSDEISEFVAETVANVTDKVTDRVRDGARTAGDGAAQFGGDALRRIISEVDQRPLMTLAIAAGIGFLAGLSRRA
jgi:ElaB/YqjD/DUF883 family membrane-anchored ribosome-binding protein